MNPRETIKIIFLSHLFKVELKNLKNSYKEKNVDIFFTHSENYFNYLKSISSKSEDLNSNFIIFLINSINCSEEILNNAKEDVKLLVEMIKKEYGSSYLPQRTIS